MNRRAPKPTPAQKAVARELLAFAIKRIRQTTNELIDCHIDQRTARLSPPCVAKEVRENTEWLRRARKAVRR